MQVVQKLMKPKNKTLKSNKFNLLTKTKLRTQEIKEKVNLLLIGVLILVSITSPFWHIFFERGASDGIFGFKSMRTFLYSFGTHFILFGCSLFLFWFIYLSLNLEKRLKRIGNLVAGLFLSVSIYYLLFIFIDTSNSPYPDSYYEIAFSLGAIFSSIIIYLIFERKEKLNQIKTRKEKLNNYYNKIYLSKREKEIAEMLHSGINDYNSISSSMTISYKTVTSHTSNIFKKANVTSKQEFINLRGKLLQ